eukprot:scaffold1875_cov253-Pinguiococcus_pyrenoidosus.AAC.16
MANLLKRHLVLVHSTDTESRFYPSFLTDRAQSRSLGWPKKSSNSECTRSRADRPAGPRTRRGCVRGRPAACSPAQALL